MKFSISKSSLENILGHIQPFLDKKDSSQITSHIYLETKGDEVLFKATDYEIGIETKVKVTKELDGAATVNGKKILEAIRALKDAEITLETDSQNLIIQQGTYKSSLPMFDTNAFPQNLPNQDQKQIKIDTTTLIQSLKKISPAIDQNNQKISLTGALLELKDYCFNFVSTDTRRLAIIKKEVQSLESFSLIIPKRAIAEIIKLFKDGDVEIFYSETQLTIKNDYRTFFTKLINDKFPDYEKIIPKEFKFKLELPQDEIISCIKRVSSLSPKFKMTFKPNEILFETMSIEAGSAKDKMEFATGVSEEFSIGIDAKYMTDFLGEAESSKFEICINETNAPFVVRDNKFSTIILPVI